MIKKKSRHFASPSLHFISSRSIFKVIAMTLLTKAGRSILRQTANRHSIHQGIRSCTSSLEALRGKTFMDSDTGRPAGLGFFSSSSAIQPLQEKDLHGSEVRLNYAAANRSNYGPGAGLGFAVNSIIGSPDKFGVGQRRSFSTGASGNTVGGGSPANEQSALGRFAAYLSILTVFPHISLGIDGILADYVHHKMTREFLHLCFDLFILIIAKNLFLALIF